MHSIEKSRIFGVLWRLRLIWW